MTDKTPTTLDAQDPLPEANWLWRRVFTFTVLAFAFAILIGLGWATNRIVGNIVGRIDTMDARNVAQITVVALNVILTMFKLMFYVVLANMLLYIVAPSAEQITKMIQTAGLLKAGVAIASRTLETPDRRETASTAAIPPQPVVPPVVDPENTAVLAPPDADTGSEATQVAPEVDMAPTAAPSEEQDYAPRSKTDG